MVRNKVPTMRKKQGHNVTVAALVLINRTDNKSMQSLKRKEDRYYTLYNKDGSII